MQNLLKKLYYLLEWRIETFTPKLWGFIGNKMYFKNIAQRYQNKFSKKRTLLNKTKL